jgi:hypothetical protein
MFDIIFEYVALLIVSLGGCPTFKTGTVRQSRDRRLAFLNIKNSGEVKESMNVEAKILIGHQL